MKTSSHFIITLITFPLVLVFSKNMWIAIPWFSLGVLIDVDHEVDYYLKYKKITFNTKELSRLLFYPPKIPFHCFEWVPFVALILWSIDPTLMWATFSFVIHIIMDAQGHKYPPIPLKMYLGLYRTLTKFEKASFFIWG